MKHGTRYSFSRPVLAILAAAALLAAVPVRADEAAESGSVDARVVTAEGEVFVYAGDAPDDGAPVAASEQAPLQAGDRIHTGDDGRAEIGLEGDSILELGPNSDFTVNALDSAEPAFTLGWGRLIAKIKTLAEGRRLVVRTPTAVAAVRGTEFAVDVAEDEGGTHVAVFDEGKVAVSGSDGEGETELGANRETEVKRGEGPRRAAKLRHFLQQRSRMAALRGRLPGLRGNWRRLDPGQRAALRGKMRERLQNMPPERREQLKQRMRDVQERRQSRRENLREKLQERRENRKEGREQQQPQRQEKMQKLRENIKERRDDRQQQRKERRQGRRDNPHGGRR